MMKRKEERARIAKPLSTGGLVKAFEELQIQLSVLALYLMATSCLKAYLFGTLNHPLISQVPRQALDQFDLFLGAQACYGSFQN